MIRCILPLRRSLPDPSPNSVLVVFPGAVPFEAGENTAVALDPPPAPTLPSVATLLFFAVVSVTPCIFFSGAVERPSTSFGGIRTGAPVFPTNLPPLPLMVRLRYTPGWAVLLNATAAPLGP